MKILTIGFLLFLSFGSRAQQSNEAALRKELFDLKSTLSQMKLELSSVNRKLKTNGRSIKGDAILELVESIEAINGLRKMDSSHFEYKFRNIMFYKPPNPLESNATYQAYKKLDSLRNVELKMAGK